MSKGLIFFCCACAILLFTIINISVGPIISGKVGDDTVQIPNPDGSNTYLNIDFSWGTANCEYFSDLYDEAKKTFEGDALKYGPEWGKNECYRKKGMHDMEYTSFIFNAVIGFVCGLLGLLHLFDVKKEYVSKTGMIGLICGFIGFVFSFVYVILNGLVYTTYYDHNGISPIYKRDSDGVFAEWKNGQFECIYYDSTYNDHALYAKYSDLIQKQYNYDKDLFESYEKYDDDCVVEPGCYSDGKAINTHTGCTKLYANDYNSNESIGQYIINKDISDRFLTTLLLSLFVCLANIGLAIFGFLLFRTPGDF